jgi:hypothetical protein
MEVSIFRDEDKAMQGCIVPYRFIIFGVQVNVPDMGRIRIEN